MEVKIVNSNEDKNVKFLSDMKPWEVGEIVSVHNHGDIVMRTASVDRFEVMNLSKAAVDCCWTSRSSTLKVRIIEGAKLTLHI